MFQELPDTFSPKRLWRSFAYAFRGLRYMIGSERNFQVHIVALVLVVILGFVFHLSSTEWSLVVLCIAMVTAAECFNTAIELLTDMISPNHNPAAGRVKDVAAAAVTLSAIGAAIVGCIIFLPHLIRIFNLL